MNQLGRYQLLAELGRGGAGVVYRALDPAIGRELALKTIALGRFDPEIGQRLAREARISGALRHPSIVTIYDVGQQGDVAYIAMELVDGQSLDRVLRSNTVLEREQVAQILTEAAEALDYAHTNGVVHRDVKPGNLMVERDGRTKITDFGIARAPASGAITQQGTLLGTPWYMSPEAIRGSAAGPQSDQYSLAVIAYELLCGRRPFEAAGIPELFHQVVTADPPPPSSFNRTLDRHVDAVLVRALRKDAGDRFESCSQFVRELLDACNSNPGWQPARPRPETPGAPPPPSPATERTVIGSLAAQSAPPGFSGSQIFPRTGFFLTGTDRYEEIKRSLEFYRNGLKREHEILSRQADLTYKLWLGCVAFGFAVLLCGVVLLFLGRITEGVATSASTLLLYFIQRIFQQREDHYRSAANQKSANLEYGNQWLLVIQSIDAIEDPRGRAERQTRLVDVLTEKLHAGAAHRG